jgi:hypothetical protein
VVEQGLPAYLLREIDLVVFPRYVDGKRYVGEVVEIVSESTFEDLDGRCSTICKEGTTIHWNTIAWRANDGTFHAEYDHAQLGDNERKIGFQFFRRLADRTDRGLEAVEAEFHRKHRYVQYLEREGVTDFEELFSFLADL